MERSGVELQLADHVPTSTSPRSERDGDGGTAGSRDESMEYGSEARPFLEEEVADEKESRRSWKFGAMRTCGGPIPSTIAWLGLTVSLIFTLTVLSLTLGASVPSRSYGSESSAAHGVPAGSQGDTHTPNLVYEEDIPETPQMRSPDEYILQPSWDYHATPTTREYYWTITNAVLNPDGVFRPMTLINNQFPGPLVEINEGDTLVVHISNRGINATSMHFHGIFQNGTNAMDGTVGVTQCAIAPGSNYTYKFEVKGQSGTYWYHAHHSAQASDGVLGPMVVHAENEKTELQKLDYETDRIVMVQDHYHNTTAELLMDYLQPGRENEEPVPDSALINGRGLRDCGDFGGWNCDNSSVGLQSLEVPEGGRHRLRFINTGAFAEFQIEIDEHPFFITEVDGTDVNPVPFHRLNILPAQRYSVIFEANSTRERAFWLRARMVTHCFRRKNPHMKEDIRAVVRYGDSAQKSAHHSRVIPTSKSWNETIEVICRDLNTSSLHPVMAQDPPHPDGFVPLRANFMTGAWRLTRGFFNGSNWNMNATSPTLHRLLDARANNTSGLGNLNRSFGINSQMFDPARDFVLQTKGIQTLDIAINNFDDGAHPFHLHGHKFFVLTPSLKGYPPAPEDLPRYLEQTSALENPLRRDTVTVAGYQWVIIRVVLDNPGMWAFHCHNAWHAEAGMVMQLLARGDEIESSQVGRAERELCLNHGVTKGNRPPDSIWFGQF